jgi:signal transduction histidine kinase
MESQARAQQRSRELFESQQETQKAYQLLETTNIRLREAEAAAVQANEFKSRFITNLSHELRTPLSAIINFSFILSKDHLGTVTEEQRDYLTRIYGAGNLLLDIVNDLLDLAKIEAGQMELFLEPVDLEAISISVMTTVSGLITDNTIELHQDIEPGLKKITGDGTRIRQILLNLLGNAVKYTNEGSITLKISQKADFVKVSITDTGLGIRPEDKDRIFEEFQQTEEAFALRKVGTGLGLPISKKFVELHGGDLWVESAYGRGSTFHFTLPVAPQAGDEESELQPEKIIHKVTAL